MRETFIYPSNTDELNDIQVHAFQQIISKKYGIEGLVNPTEFAKRRYDFCLNPADYRDHCMHQVVFAHNHWILVTNKNPHCLLSASINWFVFDSINSPVYVDYLKSALKRLNPDSNIVNVATCKLPAQLGNKDCGLFALAYSVALCNGQDPNCYIRITV